MATPKLMIEHDATPESWQDEGLVNVGDAQGITSLSRSTIYGLMEAGKLAYVKIGRSRRIPRAALRRLITESLVGTV